MKTPNKRKLNFKLQLPKPDANKILNTAFGRGMAEVVAEKQARIDRLESLILYAHSVIVRDNKQAIAFEDDMESALIESICEKYQTLKQKNNE